MRSNLHRCQHCLGYGWIKTRHFDGETHGELKKLRCMKRFGSGKVPSVKLARAWKAKRKNENRQG